MLPSTYFADAEGSWAAGLHMASVRFEKFVRLHPLRQVEQERVRVAQSEKRTARACANAAFPTRLPVMNTEINTRRIGSKWHGYIDGRPDIDETALTEEAVRRKAEQIRDRLGACGARTRLFGGKTCERVKGHFEFGGKRSEH